MQKWWVWLFLKYWFSNVMLFFCRWVQICAVTLLFCLHVVLQKKNVCYKTNVQEKMLICQSFLVEKMLICPSFFSIHFYFFKISFLFKSWNVVCPSKLPMWWCEFLSKFMSIVFFRTKNRYVNPSYLAQQGLRFCFLSNNVHGRFVFPIVHGFWEFEHRNFS